MASFCFTTEGRVLNTASVSINPFCCSYGQTSLWRDFLRFNSAWFCTLTGMCLQTNPYVSDSTCFLARKVEADKVNFIQDFSSVSEMARMDQEDVEAWDRMSPITFPIQLNWKYVPDVFIFYTSLLVALCSHSYQFTSRKMMEMIEICGVLFTSTPVLEIIHVNWAGLQ